MTPEEWTKWKNNRTTKKFFKFISDFRDQAAREVASFVADGIPVEQDSIKDATLRCQIYKDLEELEHSEIELFYKKEEEDVGDNDDRPEGGGAD